MNQRVSVVSAVLFGVALVWAIALIVIAYVLPLYTLQNVDAGPDGAIPRVTMFAQFGAAGLLPPIAMIVAVLLCAGLTLLVPGWAGGVTGLAVAGLVVLVGLGATVFFHVVGALLLPTGLLLALAAGVTLAQRASRTPGRTAPATA